MKLKLIILAAILIATSQALYLNLESKERYCFKVPLKNKESININYVVSGKKQENIEMTIWKDMELKGQPEFKVSKQQEYVHKHTGDGSPIKVCFQATDNKKKVLSFFFTTKELQFVSQDNINTLLHETEDAFKDIDIIYKNQRHQSIRERTHRRILDQTDNRVRWCSIIKIFTIIAICAVQILIIQGFFKGDTQKYTGV
ncbi:hypothetical protein PPERSA_01542 [Pseudocohnilembus persalinus]|uniref:GOLD domain-containing protein n=1 Tax=Pseudocohnilembus persalinus TaxID=266149 RepID=A0A0V0R7S7_PSEPJ|nr:hypothetical protein PPERSA_01542 [Pseudocohnilembus persalinus]|eukprot:KRX10530.1 hypothetical protein PPERSA_01542 [Pseudocohnilembus persalinus]